MGLAGTKKRIKLSHDPNNTTWTNDTESFGHKFMTAQGWQPGQFLGSQDAAHTELHTAANASHIRVTIKDDNLGLGAKIGSGVGHGECTGLDVFKNILGRLNGQEEDELEKEQKSREDLKRAYTEQKWGSIRFVPGGFLIGDKIQHLIDREAERVRKLADGSANDTSESDSGSESGEHLKPVKKTKKPKKRKADVVEEEVPEAATTKVKKSKKKAKSHVGDEEGVIEPLIETKSSKKLKKAPQATEETESTSDDESKRKKRKKEKKEKRRRMKEEEEIDLSEKKIPASNDQVKVKGTKKSKRDGKKETLESLPISSGPSLATTKDSTPSTDISTSSSGLSTPLMQGRHAVRSRNIAQKRLASMDVASLNQIFMIKS